VNQPPLRPQRDSGEIAEWIRLRMAHELGREPSSIDIRKPFARYGLDSVTAVLLTGELEEWLGCAIAPDLLGQFTSIEALAGHLAEAEAETQTQEVREWVRQPKPPLAGFIRECTRAIAALLLRLDIQDAERIPAAGPFIFACNHLHMIDAAVMVAVLRRPVVFFISEHMKQFAFLEWYVAHLGQGIYVSRGEADREALAEAVAALRAGEVLTVAPEGTISPTGGLLKGQTGIAFLAMRAGVPVLPVVAYGQEKAPRLWKRLQRPAVRVRIGGMIDPPPANARTQELEEFTENVMRAMARMLPSEYRGVYSGDAASTAGTNAAGDSLSA